MDLIRSNDFILVIKQEKDERYDKSHADKGDIDG